MGLACGGQVPFVFSAGYASSSNDRLLQNKSDREPGHDSLLKTNAHIRKVPSPRTLFSLRHLPGRLLAGSSPGGDLVPFHHQMALAFCKA